MIVHKRCVHYNLTLYVIIWFNMHRSRSSTCFSFYPSYIDFILSFTNSFWFIRWVICKMWSSIYAWSQYTRCDKKNLILLLNINLDVLFYANDKRAYAFRLHLEFSTDYIFIKYLPYYASIPYTSLLCFLLWWDNLMHVLHNILL